MRNTTSGSCTTTARASRRTLPKPCGGTGWPPNKGQANAQHNLGVMYANGEGVLKDSVLAHMWSSIAGANGNEAARKQRDNLEDDMTRAEISRAAELARTCMASDYQDCEP